jgi:hypothetical protein
LPTDYHHFADIADPADVIVVYHLYAVRAWTGDPTIRDDEHTELRWVTLLAAASMDELALEEYRALFSALASAQQ